MGTPCTINRRLENGVLLRPMTLQKLGVTGKPKKAQGRGSGAVHNTMSPDSVGDVTEAAAAGGRDIDVTC